MSLKSIVAFAILLAAYPVFSFERPVRLKNGRQYVKSLSRALNVSMYDYRPLFNELKMSLPRSGELSEFYAAKDSMAKLASFGCDILDFMEGPNLNLNTLYLRILKRSPTELEKQSVIMKNGRFDVYSNCFVLALHPEFILIKE